MSKNANGVVFVVDSQTSKLQENAQLYIELVELISDAGLEPIEFPVVVQYNKLDLPNAASVEELEKKINVLNFPHFKAVATQGTGVLPTLTTISKQVIRYLKDYGHSLTPKTATPNVSAVPSVPVTSPPATPAVTSMAELQVISAGSATVGADGVLQLPLQLSDRQSGQTFRANLRLELTIDGRTLAAKLR